MVEGPVSKRRFSRRAVRQALLIGVTLAAVAVAVAGAWMAFTKNQASRQQDTMQEQQARARELAAQVDETFAGIRRDLAALVSEPDVQALFEQGDAIELAGEASEYEDRFPDVLNLRFLLPGSYTLDQNSKPPLSYACLDMLDKAEESNGPVGAEVHLFGGPERHIVMVQRVLGQDHRLLGLVQLTLDTALFKQALDNLKLGESYVELQQSSGGRALVLAKRGDARRRQGKPVVTSIADSRWNLAFWSGEAAAAPADGPGGDSGGLLLPAAIGLVVLLAAGLLWYRRRRGGGSGAGAGPDDDKVVYGGAVKNIMDGAHPGMENLVRDLPREKATTAKARPSEALSGSDDITQMASPPAPAEAAPAQPASDGEQAAAAEAPAPAAGTVGEDTQAAGSPEQDKPEDVELDRGIFRAYDIRGVVGKNLTPAVVGLIGRAIGSEAQSLGEQTVVVGRDGRKSSPELTEALIKGLRGAGCKVIDIGEVPTPVLYYATHTLEARSGVMLTGSHNGPEYNGMKVVLGGETLSEDAIQKIYQRISDGDLAEGNGGLESAEIIPDYIRRISEDIPVALGSAYKLVVDCGNGVAGNVAPQLLRALGHDVVELYCEVDGNFPNHHPDPSQPENLEALIEKVKAEGADLGLAFDGDGDRLGVVDGNGNVIWPDRQLMVLARDVLSRNAGAKIIFDVKCSRYLKDMIEEAGGEPLMWKTGHSLIKAKMKEVDAPLAGEMSGHIFFKERWYGFDDALYTAARLLEVLVGAKAKPAEFFAEIPEGVSTPELRIRLPEDQHAGFMQELDSKLDFEEAEVIKVDGVRVEFKDGWGLLRPSNTSPYLVLRFEADDEQALARIQDAFRDRIQAINPDLQVPF